MLAFLRHVLLGLCARIQSTFELVCWVFRCECQGGVCGPTHLQEFVEQTEGVRGGQVIIGQPVPKFAVVTWFHTALFVTASLPVTVTALPLQLLCLVSAQAVLKPAGKHNILHVNAKSDMFTPCFFPMDSISSPPAPLQEMLNENTAHSRHSELKDVVESLFEQHDYSHLDEEVCQTTTRMALQHTQEDVLGLVLWCRHAV